MNNLVFDTDSTADQTTRRAVATRNVTDFVFKKTTQSLINIINGTQAMVAGKDAAAVDDKNELILHLGEDVPWALKYIKANQEQAILCLLLSLALGMCCILVALLFCMCCHRKRASTKGSFNVAKSNNSSGGNKSYPVYTSGGNRENETLLVPSGIYNPSGGRTYSSPRLIRAEYARGLSTSSAGGNTPSSTLNPPSNANLVGLYLSQAPKSRWSRASDAVGWPLPPTSSAIGASVSTAADIPPSNTIAYTLPSSQKPLTTPASESYRHTTGGNSPFPPSLATLLVQDRQTLPQKPQTTSLPPFSVHSTFALVNSPTDYLFNRQSAATSPYPGFVPKSTTHTTPNYGSPIAGSNDVDQSLFRKPQVDDINLKRKPFSYPYGANLSNQNQPYHNQHHSFMGPLHPNSPPILPAPATSPWPARNSQIMLAEEEVPTTGPNN